MSDDTRRVVFRNSMKLEFGVFFTLLGVIVAIALPYSIEVECSHGTGECVVTEKRLLLGETPQVVELERVRGAEVVRKRSENVGSGYQAVLDTRDGRIDLVSYRSKHRGPHERMADKVNAFLDDPDQPPLQASGSGLAGYIPMLFPLVGLTFLFLVRNITQVQVRPELGDLRIVKRRWWQRSGKEQLIRLADIDKVGLTFGSGRSRRKRQTAKAVLRLKSGDEVSLFGSATSGQGPYRRAEKLRKLLQPHVDHDL